MKATELRIGNLAFEKGNRVITIDGAMIKWIEEGSYRGIEPIPLTKEWLEKFGFSEMTVQPLWRKTEGEYTLDSEDFLFDFKSKHIYIDSGLVLHPIGTVVTFVHQLQNLYFALTGNELTIQEYSIK